MEMNGVNYPGLARVARSVQQPANGAAGQEKTLFSDMLRDKSQENLNFSKHAAKRMDERGIAIDNRLKDDLEHAVGEARKKGARDVAVIGSQGVFIVNIPNNVVVTTMSPEDMKQRIFTNIDSAVLM